MRILVDYRPALRARTGVGEYMHEVARAYAGAFTDRVVLFTSSWKDRPPAGTAKELGVEIVDRRVPVRVLNTLWHRAGWPPVEALAGPADVVHAAHPLLIPARRAAQVVTIHDLFFLDHPDRTRAEIRRDYAALAASHARRADAIVTPSQHVRHVIATRLEVPLDRIHVCSLGAPRWKELGQAPNLPGDGYILFLGTLEPRKNVGTLLDAYARLLERHTDAPRLVLAGGATPEARPWLDRLGGAPLKGRAVHVGYVSHDKREELYAGARLVVLPSLDEGFGIPALEAMSAGIPVIVSDRGALPEVVGSAGTIVPATDADALADAMERLVTDDGLATGRACAGLERAAAFTWTATAAALRTAYLDAVARRRER
jgi:glycosyltransferase involved in cell wall biosynthesis